MAEFLVHATVELPRDVDPDERQRLVAEERAVALRLRDSGVIQRMWRLPGQPAHLGIWRAEDATQLHDVLASMPLFRWMAIDVTALAAHPVEQASPEA